MTETPAPPESLVVEPPMRAALDAVERAERAAIGVQQPGSFDIEGRVARAVGTVGGIDLARLAHPLARRPSGDRAASMTARSASAVIVLGKYARASQVKARAFLGSRQGPLTLKVWTHVEDEVALGRRERRVRARIGRIAEYRAPEVVATGTIEGTDYLLERVVYGRHPWTAEQRLAAAEDLLETLSRAYLEHGVEERRLSEVVHAAFPERLERALASPRLPWSPDWGPRRRATRRLARLVTRDRALACSLGHGDLVATNIIRDDRGHHVLIDWEHGRVMPVAFDLVKLLLSGGASARLERRMRHLMQPIARRGRRHYPWEHQLALGLCERLSFLPERRERAEQAGRGAQLEAEVADQVGLVADLVSR